MIPDDIERLPAHPAPSSAWAGASLLSGGKGYVSAPLGQMHYRDRGPQDTRVPLLLLHQSPQCMAEFGAVQNAMCRLRIRSIVPDMPGYGLSDPPEGLPTIGGLADNLVALLDQLAIPAVVAGGHHTGACIATALAARHPGRVAGVILHGCPLYSEEDARRFLNMPEWDRTPASDGSHMTTIFKWKGVGDEDEAFSRTWMTLGMFLQGPDIAHWAVNRYAMAADLQRVSAPGLILSELDDITHPMDQRAHALRPDFMYRELARKGTSTLMTHPDEWVTRVMEFLEHSGVHD